MSRKSVAEIWGVPSGKTLRTKLKVGSDPMAELTIPVWIAAGHEDGPTVCVTAGIHGCEYAGILAAIDLFAQIDPSVLKGTLAIMPVCNPVAFARVSRYVCPIDNVNLNRVFPGDKNGSFSQRLAFEIFHSVVVRSQYLMDLHGGDLFEQQLPHVKYYASGNSDLDERARMLATVFTGRFVQRIVPEKRILGGSLFVEASKIGVPSVIGEAGSEGRVNKDDIEFHRTGMLNVLQWLGMLPKEDTRQTTEREEVFSETKLLANQGGFFIPMVRVGEAIDAGAVVAVIKDLEGRVVESIVSPAKAIVRLLFSIGVVSTGDPLMSLWETQTSIVDTKQHR
jgi:hypothetical protein